MKRDGDGNVGGAKRWRQSYQPAAALTNSDVEMNQGENERDTKGACFKDQSSQTGADLKTGITTSISGGV